MQKAEKKYNYVYRITDKEQGTYYYGMRSSNTSPEKDLGVRYFSSSSDKDFVNKQKQYPDKFQYKIISNYSTRREAVLKEVKLHHRFNVAANTRFINKANQSSEHFTTCEHNWSDSRKKHMSKLFSGNKNPFYGRKHTSQTKKLIRKNHTECAGEHNSMYGKHHKESTKQKIRETVKRNKAKYSKRIHIYDKEGLLRYRCEGNFKKVCKDNGLPLGSLKRSYTNKGKPLGSNLHQKNKQYEGWYAIDYGYLEEISKKYKH